MTSLVTIIISSPSQPFQGVPPPAKRLSCAIIAKSRRDDPTTPRYAMSGFHIRIDIFLNAICYHLTNSIFPYYLRGRLPRQHQNFLAITIDMELP